MREQRNDPKRLKDILQAIDTIFEYVGDRITWGQARCEVSACNSEDCIF